MQHNLEAALVPVDSLTPYHKNPRQGDVGRIAESLRVNGQYRPLVVNVGTHTGRAEEVLAGNHTLAGAKLEGLEQVWAVHVDVDDEAAARIVAADNRTADLGTYDDRLLAELLGDLEDLAGTGYDETDLDELLDKLDPEPTDRPDLGEPVVSFTIVFDDEGQQDEWFAYQRWLRDRYPNLATQAERLIAHVVESTGGEHAEA